MYTYNESELLRLARVRTEINLPDGRIDVAELHREVARARAEAIARTFTAIGRAFGRVFAWAGEWRRYRAAVAELESLDVRTLSDIGITRADIPRVAAGMWMPASAQPTTAGNAVAASNENARKAAA